MRNNAPKRVDEKENIEDFFLAPRWSNCSSSMSHLFLQGAPPHLSSDGMRKGAMKKVNGSLNSVSFFPFCQVRKPLARRAPCWGDKRRQTRQLNELTNWTREKPEIWVVSRKIRAPMLEGVVGRLYCERRKRLWLGPTPMWSGVKRSVRREGFGGAKHRVSPVRFLGVSPHQNRGRNAATYRSRPTYSHGFLF